MTRYQDKIYPCKIFVACIMTKLLLCLLKNKINLQEALQFPCYNYAPNLTATETGKTIADIKDIFDTI